MNLQALQYIDINSAIENAIGHGSGTQSLDSNLVQRIEGSDSDRYVVIEGPRCRHQNRSSDNQSGGRPCYLKAQPVFINSLLSTEISVSLSDEDCVNYIEKIQQKALKPCSKVIDIPLDSDLHYRLQEPIPDYLGVQMYRAQSQLIMILGYPSRPLTIDASLLHRIRQLLERYQNQTYSTERTEILCFSDGNGSVCRSLKNLIKTNINIGFFKFSQISHRLNVIGKSVLVLCDSSGIAVDSLRSSVPIVFVSEIPYGFEEIQNCVIRFLQHGCLIQLLNEQQVALDNLLQNQNQNTFYLSNQYTLHSLISLIQRSLVKTNIFDRTYQSTIYSLCYDTETEGSQFSSTNKLILNTQHTLCNKTNGSVKLKSGLASSRRKYQKFRESPTRFMEDSESIILKYLTANKFQ